MEERKAQGQTATDALRAAAHSCRCLLDRSPFPLAYVGLDGRIFYASPDFPRPPDAPASLDGVEFALGFPSAERERIARFLESCARGEVRGMALPEGPGAVVEAGFCDVIESWLPGVSFRLYPLRGSGEPVGIMARAIPTDSSAFTGPQLAQREHRQRERLAAVLEASRGISSSLERDVILESIVTRARDLVEAPEAVLFLMEPDGRTLRPVVARVEDFLDEVMALRLRLGEGIVGWVALTGRAEIVNHAENDPRSLQVPGTPVESTSLLVAPLVIKDQVAGVHRAVALRRRAASSPTTSSWRPSSAAHCSRGDRERAPLRGSPHGRPRSCARRRRSWCSAPSSTPSARWPAAWRTTSTTSSPPSSAARSCCCAEPRIPICASPERHRAGRPRRRADGAAHPGVHPRAPRRDGSRASISTSVLVQVVELTRSSWQAQAKGRGVVDRGRHGPAGAAAGARRARRSCARSSPTCCSTPSTPCPRAARIRIASAEQRRPRAGAGRRHRRRHGRGDAGAHLRPVLHDQGGEGDRPRPLGGLRHRAPPPRPTSRWRASRAAGHDVHALASRRPASRPARVRSPQAPPAVAGADRALHRRRGAGARGAGRAA